MKTLQRKKKVTPLYTKGSRQWFTACSFSVFLSTSLTPYLNPVLSQYSRFLLLELTLLSVRSSDSYCAWFLVSTLYWSCVPWASPLASHQTHLKDKTGRDKNRVSALIAHIKARRWSVISAVLEEVQVRVTPPGFPSYFTKAGVWRMKRVCRRNREKRQGGSWCRSLRGESNELWRDMLVWSGPHSLCLCWMICDQATDQALHSL